MIVRLASSPQYRPAISRRKASPPRGLDATVALSFLLTCAFIFWTIWRYWIGREQFIQAPGWLVDFLGLLTWAGLLTLLALWTLVVWRRLELSRGKNQSLSVEQLLELSPQEFEGFVAELFRERGYHVTLRGRSGDLGVDLALMNSSGRLAIVQCKRYKNAVGPDIVRELFGTMLHERAHHGFLVTTGKISDSARAWAADKPMTLIDGPTLAHLTVAKPALVNNQR